MNLQLVVALLPYLSLVVSLIVFLALFFELSRRIRILGARIAQIDVPVDKTNEIIVLQQRIEELESYGGSGTAPKPAGLNGTTRSKVLKMHRLGQPPDRIADTLKVPKGEVDLLVKVHRIVMRPYEQLLASGSEIETS